MGEGPELSLREALASVPDPRHPQGRRHPLAAILALAVGAMLGDGRSLYAIAPWGRDHPELTQALGFTRAQTPCVATWHHVFRRLDVAAFEDALTQGSLAAAPDQRSGLVVGQRGQGSGLNPARGPPGGNCWPGWTWPARASPGTPFMPIGS